MLYIEQPAFSPWLGFCEALLACQVVALYDDVQFEDGGWQNRNRIKTRTGVQWITVPVTKKHRQLVRDVRIAEGFDTARLIRTLRMAYGRTPFFAEAMETFAAPLTAGHRLLVDLNVDLLTRIAAALDAPARLQLTSEMPLPATGRVQRIRAVCGHTGQTILWAGSGTRGYLDTRPLHQAGIAVRWNEFAGRHPTYPQTWAQAGFTPALSVIDAACNLGWGALRTVLTDGLAAYLKLGAPA